MADAHGSGPCVRKDVGVQLPPCPPRSQDERPESGDVRRSRAFGPRRPVAASRTVRAVSGRTGSWSVGPRSATSVAPGRTWSAACSLEVAMSRSCDDRDEDSDRARARPPPAVAIIRSLPGPKAAARTLRRRCAGRSRCSRLRARVMPRLPAACRGRSAARRVTSRGSGAHEPDVDDLERPRRCSRRWPDAESAWASAAGLRRRPRRQRWPPDLAHPLLILAALPPGSTAAITASLVQLAGDPAADGTGCHQVSIGDAGPARRAATRPRSAPRSARAMPGVATPARTAGAGRPALLHTARARG